MENILKWPIGKEPRWYCADSDLSLEDQKWTWDNIPYISPGNEGSNTNDSINGSINGACKNDVETELALSKHEVIIRLTECNYRTPPRKVAFLLEKLFDDPETKKGHWLYVAQHWPPRAINRTIVQMIKQHRRGESVIKNPAAYFTAAISRRKQRKCFRSINDAYKQQ